MSPRRKHLTWIAFVVVAVGVVKCAVFPGRAFDAVLWKDAVRVRDGVRLGMADRLLARRTLIGLTRPEVVAMLGDPPPTSYFDEWDLVYWLGPEGGFFGLDSAWLVARLGADGRVTQARIVTD